LDREPNRRPFANGKPRRKCEALDPGQLDNSSFVKNSPFNIFSGNGVAKFSKNEQFSSRPWSTFSYGRSSGKDSASAKNSNELLVWVGTPVS